MTGPHRASGTVGGPAAGVPRTRMSLTARITLMSVAVAVAAAALSGLAAARYVAAGDRVPAATSGTSQLAPGAPAPATPAAGAPTSAAGAPPSTTTGGQQSSTTLGHRLRAAIRESWVASEHRPAQRVARAVLLAVIVGLLVGLVAGTGTARLLTRPLRRVTHAARAMGAGRRDVRVRVEGPPELADVAVSLNELADALSLSEGRQRRFLLSVSHELRTPLTAVRGYAESIADGVVTGADAAAAGAVVLAESGRLERLVHDLLDLARLGADDFRLDVADVDLVALLDSAADVWRTRARAAGSELLVERPAPDARVSIGARTDASRLRQVIDGLAENALRLTGRDGPVVLVLRAPGPADPPGTRGVFQVRDGGPGLAPEDYAVAFEPGVLGDRYRDSRPGGVGIGLSLVHGLARRLGSTVTAGPAPEGGACFTIVVRDAPDPPAAPATRATVPPAADAAWVPDR